MRLCSFLVEILTSQANPGLSGWRAHLPRNGPYFVPAGIVSTAQTPVHFSAEAKEKFEPCLTSTCGGGFNAKLAFNFSMKFLVAARVAAAETLLVSSSDLTGELLKARDTEEALPKLVMVMSEEKSEMKFEIKPLV